MATNQTFQASTSTFSSQQATLLKSNKPPLDSCLFLADDALRFEPVSDVTAVFFDESNSQLIISRSNGAGGIVVKSKKDKNLFNLRLQNSGDITSLNFSPDSRILAIKRTNSKNIDLANVFPGYETKEYSQACKLKNSKVLGVCWVTADELAIVTDKGVEYYQIFPDKRVLKLLKTTNLDVNWYLWMAQSNLLMLSTGSLSNAFYALHFKDNTFSKMAKMEIDIVTSSSSPTSSAPSSTSTKSFKQKDFMLINVYNTTYMARIVVERSNNLIEVHLFAIKRDGCRGLSESLLLLNCSGRVVVSVVDNLIVLHHHGSKTSHIYDIGLDNYDIRGGIKFHLPILPSLSIRPFKPNFADAPNTQNDEDDDVSELYSSHWVIFSPDVILDAKKGFYWNLRVDLEAVVALVEDKVLLVGILLLRSNSLSLILKVVHDLIIHIADSPLVDLTPLSQVFEKFNRVLANHHNPNKEELLTAQQVVQQLDFHGGVLLKLHKEASHGEHHISDRVLDGIIIEYLVSLSSFNIPPESQLLDLLISRLLQQNKQHQLQQMLQYRLFPDSKALAIRLLSLGSDFPAANQLALDMLRRMSSSLECIFELLLSNKQVISAIRYAQSLGLSDQLKARKFLQVALDHDDKGLFLLLYNYFRDKNIKNKGSPDFLPVDQCEEFVEYHRRNFKPIK